MQSISLLRRAKNMNIETVVVKSENYYVEVLYEIVIYE